MIAAVLFDLDDTLFDQQEWLAGAWEAVADAAAASGVDRTAIRDALQRIAAQGSDGGKIIDRALADVQAVGIDVSALVSVFRAHAPARLTPHPGVPEALARLAAEIPLGLVTDGDVAIQRAKLVATGMREFFSAVVFSDALGRENRKPAAAPFLAALGQLGVAPEDAVYVGDRPDKDVAGPMALGMRSVRVRTGEYAHVADGFGAWREVAGVPEAVDLLLHEVSADKPV